MESARCRAFVAAVDTGSFTAAGKQLDYTPSGVSQLVRALENELGLVLLSRRNRGVTLTREGEKIYPKVGEYIDCEKRMMSVADSIASLSTGEVTIATFTSIAANYLPAILREFNELYPNISLKIIEAAKYRIEEMINNNVADIAFCSELESVSCDFFPLMEDRLVAVLPPGHKYAKAGSFPLSACANEDLIMPAKGNDLDVLKALKENNIDYHIKFSTVEDITAAHMVSEDLGISITNELALRRPKNREYVIVPVEPYTKVVFGATLLSAESAPPAVRKFLEFASKKMARTESGHI